MTKEELIKMISTDEGFESYLNSLRAEGALLVAERMRKARYVFKDMHHGVVSECADIAVDAAKKLRAAGYEVQE